LRFLKPSARFSVRIFSFAALAALSLALVAAPHRIAAQQPAAASQRRAANSVQNPSTAETPKSEEEQERAFLNSPMVHKFADILHVSEPTARVIFLVINFLIIFLAIVIPLSKAMPKLFRSRTQTLRHSLDEARKASEEARLRMSAVEAKLAGLGDEIAAFRTQVEQESVEDEKRIKASIQEESERIVAAAEQEIGAAAAHARRGLREFAADLAIDHAARQIKLTPETDRALIHEFIGQVAAEGEPAAAAASKGGNK
jgi:F-type H+-transporting ATPase subunit b